jgi:hypothetical protein
MKDEHGRLDDDLLAMVRREGHAPALPAARVARARERLEMRLFVGVGSTVAGAATNPAASAGTATKVSTASATTVALGKVGGIAALTFVLGMATGWGASRYVGTDAPQNASVSALQAPTASAVPAPVAPSFSVASSFPGVDVASLPTPPTLSAPAPRAGTSAPPESGRSVDTVVAERTLLDRAHRALREGDGSRVLELSGRHEHDFPRGALVEEREVLRVNALVSLGRFDEAKARMNAFRKRFPTSPFLPALDSQLRDR